MKLLEEVKIIIIFIYKNKNKNIAALILDYGSANTPTNSLRGIKDHQFVHPLDTPGEIDLV